MLQIYFNNDGTLGDDWKIVNDTVMGGHSGSTISLDNNNHLSFKGHVSLEDNGGFAMCQYYFDKMELTDYSKFVLRLKGDGKAYQFRVKASSDDSHSYIKAFKTNGEWQTVELLFQTMYPSFRGRKLDKDNFYGKQVEMIAFLIGNKKEEFFHLQVESIVVL